jgi:glycosyltransferase involved in cell wall biosynthesis
LKKIGILGTRGIPNYYGGFEQFAEYLSVGLVKMGYEVYVYNSSIHPYKDKEFKGVKLISCSDWEDKIGTAGQFVYDLNCILDARKRNFDILLQLGYTSSSVFHRLLPKGSTIITNMDGLEWKRSKYSKKVQNFLKYAERLAVKSSDYLVSDSIGIKTYLKEKYNAESTYIAYGANPVNEVDVSVLDEFKVQPNNYNMLIARFEPENSLETILDGAAKANTKTPFLVVGKHETPFGNYLKNKYKNQSHIVFTGPVYQIEKLDALRWHSKLYFHGHQVGGTNPSLLEAMASHSVIAAHNNNFNKGVLKENAFYFETHQEVMRLIDLSAQELESVQPWRKLNQLEIEANFTWAKIIKDYETLFLKCFKGV